MEMYMTKYALTEGIRKVEVIETNTSMYVRVDGVFNLLRVGRDVFEKVDDAINNAEEKRINKIRSLNKQMKKLSSIKFEIN